LQHKLFNLYYYNIENSGHLGIPTTITFSKLAATSRHSNCITVQVAEQKQNLHYKLKHTLICKNADLIFASQKFIKNK